MTELLDKCLQPDYVQDAVNDKYIPDMATYLRASIALAADPTPSPDHLTTTQLVTPIIEQLVGTPDYLRGEVIDSLARSYIPAATDPQATGPINKGQASRNIVSQTIYEAQKFGLEHDDVVLASQMSNLASSLVLQEVRLGDGSTDNVPSLLSLTLQRAIHEQSGTEPSLDPTLNGDGTQILHDWPTSTQDTLALRDALSGLVRFDKVDFREQDTVDFLLTQYGLDPVAVKYAWTIGNNPSTRPEENVPNPGVVTNLKRIAEIEFRAPGISARLNQTNLIKNFARLSVPFLIYLDRMKDDLPGSVIMAGTDENTTNFHTTPANHIMFESLVRQAHTAGHKVDYYEITSTDDLKIAEQHARERNPNLISVLHRFHSDGYQAGYGRGASGRFGMMDILANPQRLVQFYEGVKSVNVHGCSSSIKDGYVRTLEYVVRGVSIFGLSNIIPVHTSYSKDRGFVLTKGRKNSQPLAAAGDRFDPNRFNLGKVTEHYRLPPELELLEAQMGNFAVHFM